MTNADQSPVFRPLDDAEREALLARNTVGRLAFADGPRVDIVPLGYRADGAWLFGRTAPGSKLRALAHRPWVAFEVDEVDGPFDWRSVVVHGSFHLLDPEGSERDRTLVERATQALGLADVPGDAADPAPFRTVLFAIHVDESSGRSAATRGAPAAEAPPAGA